MYYVISEDDGTILETSETMSDAIIRKFAEDFECDVYAIRGEHSGYSASRPTPLAPDAATPLPAGESGVS